ncbi:MAG: hypothetical protein MUE94_11485 [Verrucomicrobia bacterium]|jgi:hypothetical protein|nr:hypothetical protein [Verrucomicrobiota bacterium]
MSFNPRKDKIAITIPGFTLLRHADSVLQRYNEPYITSLAIDAVGAADPRINFNFMPFPKIARGGTVTMLGDGHLVYGPKQPGDFVAVSVLVMENDREMRDLGRQIEKVVQSKAVDLGIKAVVSARPGHAAVLGVLKELTQWVAAFLKENRDDELFRTEGTFLRGHPVPYHINRSYEVGNDFVRLSLNVLPLQNHNGQGPAPKALDF